MRAEPSRTVIELVRDDAGLPPHLAAWDALAERAIEPNVFFESGALRAALRHLRLPGAFCGVFVYRVGADGRRTLIAFAPLVRAMKGPRGWLPSYRLLTYVHCNLSTPLIHREHVDEALDALLDWMDGAPDGVRLFGLYTITGDGPVAAALYARLAARGQPHLTEITHDRAFLRLGESAASYLTNAIGARKRKELGRQRRRLEEQGKLVFVETTGGAEAAEWIGRFVVLEAKGWKGRRGVAFNRTPEGRQYFAQFIEHFVARGRAMLLSLRLDGTDIAMKCNLVAPDGTGAFAFKIAHEESLARYSPGVLLELDNIRRLHDGAPGIAWMDSCAIPDHPMIDHLWSERRRIVYVLCGSRGPVGRALVALFRWRNCRWRAGRP
ncbi:MAG TPA: GNAT family N-acetyltransferase [Methylomirabilota bacterium]|nr:GNAT family N-acetyltransferase [Methylomirabilota bacterium]